VFSFLGRVNSIGHDVHRTWVYADGRLIWVRNLDVAPTDRRVFGGFEPTPPSSSNG
jgi:hypothetical protein